RTINCYEKGYDMTVENVQKCSTRHNRCGTTFLFFVMIVSILMFSLANWGLSYFSWGGKLFVKMGVRLALLPIVAGLSYELLRFLARLPDNVFTDILRAPGLALQRLTTYPPDDEMAEVALKSFLTVLAMDEDLSMETVRFGEYRISAVGKECNAALTVHGLDEREAAAETDWILCSALGCRRNDLRTVSKLNLSQYRAVNEMIGRRVNGEPLDYILGKSEFFGHTLKVTPAVLIPRMETERLAEEAIKRIGEADMRVLDLCTGSGCIALAIAKATRAKVVASDLSEDALGIARINLKDSGVELLCGDLFDAVNGEDPFDIIVTNPPYIKREEIDMLQTEVRAQPRLALDGGSDGLAFYRRIAESYARFLNKD
ncbi:MAG: peptide chain release factor N(5)-glutamine methyltransferase, partial [Clostridiales bacterium]|nr:peptide chain release factor N(5)-glutamine methyltransferase [Clostridiales bacterium]